MGRRNLPWAVVLLSVVATETSTLTFLSIPGVAYGGSVAFIQIGLGYVLGRIAVSWWLLPAYRAGKLSTAYELLENRFGLKTRRLTSGIFMGTRLLADSVRLFATAIPLALITGWSMTTSMLFIGALTCVYTFVGGIRAVVWVDASQLILYMLGGLYAAVLLGGAVDGGWAEIFARSTEAGKLDWINTTFDFGEAYTLWAGLVGGAFLSMGSHGADQLIVQRLLACKNLRASQLALVGSGFAVILQFALFLVVGLGLWVWFDGTAFTSTDDVFPRFIVEALPTGIKGLLIAGVFAAAMSTLSSSINGLSSATTYDFWHATRPDASPKALLRVGKMATLAWSTALVLAAIGFSLIGGDNAAVEVSLSIASLVYGGLLGAFALALFAPRVNARSVRAAIVVGIGAVTLVWVFASDVVAWPWLVVIGTFVTTATGLGLTAVRGSSRQ